MSALPTKTLAGEVNTDARSVSLDDLTPEELASLLGRFRSSVQLSIRYPEHVRENFNDTQKLWFALSDEEKDHLFHLQQQYAGGLKRVLLSTDSGRRENNLGGHAIVLHPDTLLDRHSIDVLKAPFQCTVMAHVPLAQNSLLSDRVVQSRRDNLANCVHALNKNRILPSIRVHFDPEEVFDRARWTPSLCGTQSFAGVYSCKLHGNSGEKRYFVIVSTNAGTNIASELARMVVSNQMTAGDFAQDRRVQWAQAVAKRNAERTLYQVAESLGLCLQSTDDVFSHTPPHHETPKRAVADVSVLSNTVSRRNWGSAIGDAVVFYNGCADGAEGKLSTLIRSAPHENILEIQGHAVDLDSQQIENAHFNILPTFTHSITKPARITQSDKTSSSYSPIGEALKEKILNRICVPVPPSSEQPPAKDLVRMSHNVREPHDRATLASISRDLGLSDHDAHVRTLKPALVCLNTL